MDRYISLRFGKGRIRISLMCIAAFIYMSRYSIFSFAKCFHISTALPAAATLMIFIGSLATYTIMSRRVCWDGVAVILGTMAFFGVTLLFHPEYRIRYMDPYFEGRFSVRSVYEYGAGIYTFYLIRMFRHEKEKLYKVFHVLAYTILCLEIWTIFLNRSEEYLLTFGYQMEIAAMLFLASYLENRKKSLHLFLSIVCMAAGVLYGPRGCILGFGVFFAVYLFWKRKMNARQGLLITLALTAAICYSSQTIMKFIYNLFASLGFHSRTLYYIAQGDVLAVDSARQDSIWPVLIDAIKDMPIFGMYGAYGDRYLLPAKWPYAHNFLFEIILTFGFILGGGFLIWIAVQLIKVIRYNRDKEGLLAILIGCFVLCKLAISNTFWQEPFFWAFIAVLLNCRDSRKQLKKHGKLYVRLMGFLRNAGKRSAGNTI